MNQTFADETERAERREILKTKLNLLFDLAEKTIPAEVDRQSAINRYRHIKEIFQ